LCNQRQEREMLIVVSAPSGAGKSTLCKELVRLHPEIKLSISYTTRQPRAGEKDGKDYFFVSEEEFKKKIKNDEFLEWATVHGCSYGTEKKFVLENLSKNKDVLLEIDVQGAMKIRSLYPDVVLIFVLPPDFSTLFTTLKKRLLQRGREDSLEIRRRLKQAKKELNQMKKYDYLVINDQIKKAVKRLEAIILAERFKISRLGNSLWCALNRI